MNEREALVGLNLVPGIGPVSIRRLIQALGSAEAVFSANVRLLREIIGRFATEEVLESIRALRDGRQVAQERMRAEELGVRMLTLQDEGYPVLLKEICDPPPVLYVKGMLLKEDEAAVAIVGTRRSTLYGLSSAGRLSKGLARCGVTVVSGLAEGIDGAAHEGALEAGGRTIAVLGHGFNFLYPRMHQRLSERITRSGALVSEFPFKISPVKGNFPRRNRLISGLSLGVLVVEAPIKSGALLTAREALDQGREVFAIPGPVSSPASRGTHQLIRDGAKLVEGPQDVLEEIEQQLKSRLDSWRLPIPGFDLTPEVPGIDLTSQERQVFDQIPVAGMAVVDALVKTTGLPVAQLLPVLTGLEMKGVVAQAPGRGFSRRVG